MWENPKLVSIVVTASTVRRTKSIFGLSHPGGSVTTDGSQSLAAIFYYPLVTFRAEYDEGTYAGYYAPPRVIVLCNAGTMSAGFSVVAAFDFFGAVTVGTPSSQAPHSYGAAAVFTLAHTRLRGMVPLVPAVHFGDDPSRARVLPLDHPMTYERLKSYGFDPNAEYLYALTLPS